MRVDIDKQQPQPDCASRRHWLLAMLALGVAGCAKEDGQSRLQPYPNSPAVEPESKPTEKSAGEVTAVEPRPADDRPNLIAGAELLPGLIDSATEGAFVDLVRGVAEAYTLGTIEIRTYPAVRAYANVVSGTLDFAFPVMRLSEDQEKLLPYRYTTEALGRVCFVLYSNSKQALTRDRVIAAAAQGTPYLIEGPHGNIGVPTKPYFDFDSAFQKLSAGRIDGFIWAQEEADLVLRRIGLRNIHRARYAEYDDVFAVARSPRGDFVDKVLSETIRAMRNSGKLTALYEKVHRPYLDWQPL